MKKFILILLLFGCHQKMDRESNALAANKNKWLEAILNQKPVALSFTADFVRYYKIRYKDAQLTILEKYWIPYEQQEEWIYEIRDASGKILFSSINSLSEEYKLNKTNWQKIRDICTLIPISQPNSTIKQ